jgi:lipoprotein signal peptidase
MFVLYAIAIGLVVGKLAGGSISALAEMRIRWSGLILAGLIFQVVLFSGPVADRVGDFGPLLYVVSTAVVLGAVLRNWQITGLPIVVVGALSNAAAILANGGFMPVSPGALLALGRSFPDTYSNSSIVAHPALEPLTDIFAVPPPLPFANVFSIGDVQIAVGVVVVITVGMLRRRQADDADLVRAIPLAEPSEADIPAATNVA